MNKKKPKWVLKQATILLIIAITLGFLLLVSVIVVKSNEENTGQDTVGQAQRIPIPEIISIPKSEPEQTRPPLSTETPYPKPTYIPTLRFYDIDKSGDIWFAKDPSSYIKPNNAWVKYYASQLFVDYDGRIKYKNEEVVWWVDGNGIQYYTYKPFVNNYVYDWEQFGTGSQGSLANDDYWANADYYLTHGMKGDCDEWMNTITSIMLSGEMSIWNEGKLIKQIVPAKSILGYVGVVRDGWVEYQAYGKVWITSTSREKNPETNEYYSATIFIEKDNQFRTIFEFTDKYFRTSLK